MKSCLLWCPPCPRTCVSYVPGLYTGVWGDVERLQGRIKLLEETAAFSLISVTLELKPAEMAVDAGEDKTTGVHEVVRFRVTLKPPEEYERYVFTWNFGDGSYPVTIDLTAPTEDPGTRVTATVTHQYGDERDSPYFVEVKISGTGDAGIAEGEDSMVVSVSQRPVVQVFAGKAVTVDEGEEVEFSGSLEEGVTNALATHVYADDRPFPYTATLTITARSDAGNVEVSSAVNVQVQESEGWVVGGWSVEDQGKAAVRAISKVGQWIATALIWAGILAPVWALVGLRGRGRVSTHSTPQARLAGL